MFMIQHDNGNGMIAFTSGFTVKGKDAFLKWAAENDVEVYSVIEYEIGGKRK